MFRSMVFRRIVAAVLTVCVFTLVACEKHEGVDVAEPEPAPAKPTPALVTTTSPPKAAPDATTARFTLVTTPAAQIALDGEVQGRHRQDAAHDPGDP